MTPVWRAWQRLAARDRHLLVEASVLLFSTRVCLALLPSRSVGRWISGGSSRSAAASVSTHTPTPRRIAWAVTAAGRRLPFQTTCLVDGLVARVMLRRRGYLPRLCVGVQPFSSTGSLKAHAWVECDGEVVVGEAEDLHRYTRLEEQAR